MLNLLHASLMSVASMKVEVAFPFQLGVQVVTIKVPDQVDVFSCAAISINICSLVKMMQCICLPSWHIYIYVREKVHLVRFFLMSESGEMEM